ncbi:ATPase inhibitor subunit zeta [Ensifer adhaerens]|uniref:ATPase inhibitor subunit zeta n=1 Tax=Ensifer adhaerens TaxID=106592 RepID=UPI001F28DE8B|nr:ATPase inhibitor subunit zeta [Ensifer adhaerens]
MAGLGADMVRMVRRNKLVGFWAAEKLALAGENAKIYSDDLAMAALDVERSNILAIIRRDFDAAGVIQSDEDILAVMNVCLLKAGKPTKGSDGSDAALLHIARNLMQGS